MTLHAGQLNRRIRIERRVAGTDDAGQPLDQWVLVGELWAAIANETGLGAIRSSLMGDVPSSIARYSFLVRFEAAKALGVNAGDRVVEDDTAFDIKGLTQDLKNREKAFIVTSQGGNDG